MRSATPAEACGGGEVAGTSCSLWQLPVVPWPWGGSLCSLCPRGDEAAVGKFLGFPLSLPGQITVR